MKKYLYRYESWAGDGDEVINLLRFEVRKETPAGFWFKNKDGFDKWVGKSSRRPYAYQTEEKAIFSFYQRKIRYLEILKSRMKTTELALKELLAKKDAFSTRHVWDY